MKIKYNFNKQKIIMKMMRKKMKNMYIRNYK